MVFRKFGKVVSSRGALLIGLVTFFLAAESKADPDAFTAAVEIGTGTMPAIAVDSSDRIHLIYHSTDKLLYRTGSIFGPFSDAEVVFEEVNVHDPRIVLDKNGDPHVVASNGHTKNTTTWYTNRIGGSWKPKINAFSKFNDGFDRVTMPTVVVDDDMPVYAAVFTAGWSSDPQKQGAIARIEKVAQTPEVVKTLPIYVWNPQVLLSGGKLWVGGRNKAKGGANFTFQQHSKSTLAETGDLYKMSGGTHGESGRAVVDHTGDLHAAGTINGSVVDKAGWYNSFSRQQQGKSAIRFHKTVVNPSGAGVPVRDMKASDRVYVFYWSGKGNEEFERTSCTSPDDQIRFVRIEGGEKMAELKPVTDRTDRHGPSYRQTPAAAPLRSGGAVVVFRECNGGIFLTVVGESDGTGIDGSKVLSGTVSRGSRLVVAVKGDVLAVTGAVAGATAYLYSSAGRLVMKSRSVGGILSLDRPSRPGLYVVLVREPTGAMRTATVPLAAR